MDENHQDKTEIKMTAPEEKLSPPLLSSKDHKELDRPQNNRMGAIIKISGFFGYDKETKEYNSDGQLTKITKEHQPGKTLWDWLQLVGVLLIPLVIFLATLRFNQQQADLAQQSHLQDRANALDQQQATILQTYLDNIQDLLLHEKLLQSKPNDDVAILARARTLTALQGLDPVRKGQLLTFLYEAKLIGFTDFNFKTHNSIIHLDGALLTHADLHDTILWGADLRGAILTGADLTFANLEGADLTFADLRGSNLSNADLRGAILGFTGLTQQQIDQVSSCRGAFLPPRLTCYHNQ